MAKKAVITFGRFNPPTKGHQVVLDTMVRIGKTITDSDTSAVSLYIIPSRTQDSDKNPLSVEFREQILDEVTDANFHIGIENEEPRTILEAAHILSERDFDELYVVVGSDRVSDFQDLLNKYNGTETKKGDVLYEFDAIQVTQAGDTRTGETTLDPDADVSGASASAARKAARDNDFDTFRSIFIDPDDENLARKTFKMLQDAMGISPSEEDDTDDDLPEGEAVEEKRRQTKHYLESLFLHYGDNALEIQEAHGEESFDDEEDGDIEDLQPRMTKTFVRHGMVEGIIHTGSEVTSLGDLSFKVKQLREKYGNDVEASLVHLAEDMAVVFSYLAKTARAEGNLAEVHLSPIPRRLYENEGSSGYNRWLRQLLTRRGEAVGLGVRFTPTSYSKYLGINTRS